MTTADRILIQLVYSLIFKYKQNVNYHLPCEDCSDVLALLTSLGTSR